MQIIYFDVEVFRHNWLMVAMLPSERRTVCIKDRRYDLEKFYNEHKKDIWVGYNSTHYDVYIIQAILCGFEPYRMSQWIIEEKRQGWQFSKELKNFPILSYDCMINMKSLKQLEAFMGVNIEECSIDFDIDRALTTEELFEVEDYCTHDVEQTAEVFQATMENFQTQINLIKAFGLPLSAISKSQSSLVAEILGAKKKSYKDEFDVSLPDTLVLGEEYNELKEWYRKAGKYSESYEKEIAGVKHTFGWGGLHGARENYQDSGYFILADVSSLYPSLMLRYGYFSRSAKSIEKYREIYNKNLELKAKKDPMRKAYKLVCNTAYGVFKDRNNALYDPLMANNICVAGQLLLVDLMEKLIANVKSFELVQTNTDGVLFKYDGSESEFERIDDTVYEWEQRTGLKMEFAFYDYVAQKDVNNYIAVNKDGYKSKGAYVKKLSHIDNDLAILNEAVINYFIHGIDARDTIEWCNELSKFMKVCRLTDNYIYGCHNGRMMKERTYRVFASRRESDGTFFKVKNVDGHLKGEKYPYTSERVFINNGDIRNATVPDFLDKEWYIREAEKRIKDFCG